MCTIEAFPVTSWLPEAGCSSLLHTSCAWRNSIPALGLGVVSGNSIRCLETEGRGNAFRTHLVIRGGVLFV